MMVETLAMDLSRREFFAALGALAFGPCAQPCGTTLPPPPSGSPMNPGPFAVGRALLGVTPGTTAVPMPAGIIVGLPLTVTCDGVTRTFPSPSQVDTMVYYPAAAAIGVDQAVQPVAHRRFPLIVFAHARRFPLLCRSDLHPALDASLLDVMQDFKRVDFILSHVASHGFVVCAPNLGPFTNLGEDLTHFHPRAVVVMGFVDGTPLPATLREAIGWPQPPVVGLFGHSSGADASIIAARGVNNLLSPNVRAMAFLAPAVASDVMQAFTTQSPPVVIVHSENDHHQGANGPDLFASWTPPRVLVRVGGANHFGFTDLCDPGNSVCAARDDPGTISRYRQQLVGATFLAAAARRFLGGDETMNGFLNGHTDTGLTSLLPSLQITASF